MSYLNLKRRVGAWCLPARARERSVNIEPRAGRRGPGPERGSGESRAPLDDTVEAGSSHGFRQKMEG